MKILVFKNFRCILKLIRNFISGVEIITIGIGLCLKNIFHLFYLACLTLMAMACYVYFLTVFASIIIAGLGALIMGFVFVLKLFSLKKGMSKYTISNSFIHFIVFKTDWVNVHMMAIAKIILIYFINFKNIGGCELNILFIFFTLFYTALLFVCSDFVIQIMFNIQQGVFTIAKGLENWNINNCKDNEENNTNINNVNNVNGTGDQGIFSSLDEKIIFPNLNISGILSDTGIIGTGDLYGGGKSQLNSKGTQGVGIVGLFLDKNFLVNNNYRFRFKGHVINKNNLNNFIRFYSTMKDNENVIDNFSNRKFKSEAAAKYLTRDKQKQKKILTPIEKEILTALIGTVGFKSYDSLCYLGNLVELLDNRELLTGNLGRFLSSLSDKSVHTALVVLRWVDGLSGELAGVTIGDSLELTTNTSPKLLGSKIVIQIEEVLRKYGVEMEECEVIIMHRKWLDLSAFTTDIATISQTIDSTIIKELYKIETQDLGIQKRLDRWSIGRYNSIKMGEYGEEIIENGDVIGYKMFNDEAVVVKDIEDENGVKSKLVTVKEIIDGKLVIDGNSNKDLIQWIDTKTDFGFIREMDKVKKYFNREGKLDYSDGEYYFPDYPVTDLEFELDSKVGAIDFETFGDNGLGNQNVL